MKKHFFNTGLVLLLLLPFACNTRQEIAEPIIDVTSPYLPLIKIPLTAVQKKAGQKAGWETVSALFVVENGKAAAMPVAARYRLESDTLYYTPFSPLGADLVFQVQVYSHKDTAKKPFTTPPSNPATPPPGVAAIYPLASTIPANILMFHAVFTEPMITEVQAYKNVKLLDEKGIEKQMVWRHKSNWTADGRHLVLMLHPGRIKRGIRYFEEGDVLFEPGKKYTLVITTELRDIYNRPLEKEFTKVFTIAAADRSIPVIEKQGLKTPKAGSREPLLLSFNEGMDYGAMLIGLEITDESGKKTEGAVEAVSDKSWSFTPALPWAKTTYMLQLNDYVTDIASNHLNRRFEETDIKEMKKRQPKRLSFKPQ